MSTLNDCRYGVGIGLFHAHLAAAGHLCHWYAACSQAVKPVLTETTNNK